MTDTPEAVRMFSEGNETLIRDFGRSEERVIGVHSIICDEAGPGEHWCDIHGFPPGDARRHESRDFRVDNIGAVLIEDGLEPKETWETMGETGLIWVDRGESPYGKDIPNQCEVRSDPDYERDRIVCWE